MMVPYGNRPYGRALSVYPGKSLVPYAAASAIPAMASVVAPYIYNKVKSYLGSSGKKRTISKAVVKANIRKPVKGKRTLKKQVKNLSKIARATMGTLIYRRRYTQRMLASVNQKNHAQLFGHNEVTSYEDVLAQLRFFNPSAPGTLVQGSGATGTYQRSYLFKSFSSKLKISNNYQVPVEVMLYCCQVKRDTSINPDSAFTNGLTDVGAPSDTSPMTYLTDSQEFNDLYKIVKSVKKVLMPGRTMSASYGVKDVDYEPALTDSQTMAYQRKNKSFSWVLMIKGVIGHDTSADEQGTLAAGVDIENILSAKVEYDAGIDLKYIYITDGADTFTNGGVVSSKPVSDNIGYSVA